MSDSRINISDSFDHALPTDVRETYESPVASISGTSTQAADAPGFAIQVSFRDIWNYHATAVLNTVDLKQHTLASWEETRRLEVEGDVEDASGVQLLNPVNLAISARYPDKITCLNQHVVKSVRADVCWLRRITNDEVPFAVMDYKKVGIIRDEEFRNSTRKPAECQTPEDCRKIAMDMPDETLFEGNSQIILKQATNYANKYKTRYVAIFDWDALLLLVLDDQEGDSGGDWCFATIVRDRRLMRRALLGFLDRAYKASLAGDGSGLVPPMPFVASFRAPSVGASSARRGRSAGRR